MSKEEKTELCIKDYQVVNGNTPELFKALAEAQKVIIAPKKDKVGQYQNKYSSLDAIYEACRIPLADHGLTLQEDVEKEGSEYWLTTMLSHVSGQRRKYSMPIIIERGGCQGFVSALTYARRAAITSLLALPQEDDDDGAAAMGNGAKPANGANNGEIKITPYQLSELSNALNSLKDPTKGKAFDSILIKYNIKKLADLPFSKLEETLAYVNVLKNQG